ncbi:MAG: hypothetical protein PWP16_1220 [Eubacteriaceae bacterium]|jgi:hypothetical protein|nr:hypothetical protein [Eubacteriaceae bacterium]
MEKIKANNAVLFKVGVFIAYIVLYILLQRLEIKMQELTYSSGMNSSSFLSQISIHHLITALYVINFVQWLFLGGLFYFLGLKHKPKLNFSLVWFILFLCLFALYTFGTWGYFAFHSAGWVRNFLGILFIDEMQFAKSILPALSGFFLMCSLFDAKEVVVNDEEAK